jgi:hypothetical protein
MQRLARVGFREEQAHAVQEHAGDCLVIAFGVAVHASDALIVAVDQPRQFLVEVDVGPPQQQIRRRGEVRFVSPFGPRQRARDHAFPEIRDLGVGSEKSGSIVGH